MYERRSGKLVDLVQRRSIELLAEQRLEVVVDVIGGVADDAAEGMVTCRADEGEERALVLSHTLGEPGKEVCGYGVQRIASKGNKMRLVLGEQSVGKVA